VRSNEHILCDNNNNIFVRTFHSKVLPKIRSYNEHHHAECELSLFISGSGIYNVSGKEYVFNPGDMFLFGSNEMHCITQINEELDLLNVHFNPRILWERSESLILLRLFSSRSENFKNKISANDEKLKYLILNLENEMTEQEIAYSLQVKYMIFSALTHILRTYDYTYDNGFLTKNSSVTKKLKEALIYIDENLSEKITLKEIAEIACMTPTYFSSVFKRFNGLSLWDYITIKRVENAIHLLKTTDMTKLEIANKCGFSSASNFYKLFSKITGKTPNDYVNQ
jgi:AraC-like DNA-binding protein